MLGAIDFGVRITASAPVVNSCAVAIASFADIAELVLASARVLLWDQPDPGREVPP